MKQLDERLLAAGLAADAPIGLLLRNRVPMVGAIVGVLATGRCIVSVSPLQGTSKLADDLRELRLPALVGCEEDWLPDVIEAAREAGTLGIALTGQPEAPCLAVPDLESRGAGPHRADLPGIAIEMLTSGTTGRAKRVTLSYAALEQSFEGAAHYQSDQDDTPRLRNGAGILYTPLVHIGGMWHVIRAIVEGRQTCLMDRFAVDGWLSAVRRHRPKATGLVPTAMRMVLDSDATKDDLASLRAVLSGTAPLSTEMQLEFEQRFGIPVLITYGATEFAGAVAGWTIHDHREWAESKRGSVGRAHPGCELRIVDPGSDAVLAADESGVLEVRSAQIGVDKGWVRTTDLARLDADSFLWIEGRVDGAINRGGFKIDPAGVARVLEQHPAVHEAIVVALPDARLGQVPVAAVQLREGAQPPSESELQDFTREHLPRYHVPSAIRIVNELPRTPSLKVSHDAVRSLFAPGD